MDVYEARRANLIALLGPGGSITAAELSRRTGIAQSQFTVYQYEPHRKGFKRISEETARRIEALFPARGKRWLDEQHSPGGKGHTARTEAQVLSLPIVSHEIPKMRWEQIMKTSLPALFRAELPDDAMAPEFPKGTELVWSTRQRMIPGRVVLVRDKHGQVHARECRQGAGPGEWSAVPRNDAYVTLQGSAVDLIAVSRGKLDPPDEET